MSQKWTWDGGRPTSPRQRQGRQRKIGMGLETDGELVGAHKANKLMPLSNTRSNHQYKVYFDQENVSIYKL